MTMMTRWMHGLTHYVRAAEPDLTNRQLAVLMLVHFYSGPHTVRGLAQQLNVSKPVITRALDKLAALGFLMRQADESDGRNVFIVATIEGGEFLAKFEGYFDEQKKASNGSSKNAGMMLSH